MDSLTVIAGFLLALILFVLSLRLLIRRPARNRALSQVVVGEPEEESFIQHIENFVVAVYDKIFHKSPAGGGGNRFRVVLGYYRTDQEDDQEDKIKNAVDFLLDDYAVELIVDRMAYYDREKKRPNDKVLTDKGGSEKEDNTEGTVILKKLECVKGGEKCTPPEGVKDRLKSNLSSSFKFVDARHGVFTDWHD